MRSTKLKTCTFTNKNIHSTKEKNIYYIKTCMLQSKNMHILKYKFTVSDSHISLVFFSSIYTNIFVIIALFPDDPSFFIYLNIKARRQQSKQKKKVWSNQSRIYVYVQLIVCMFISCNVQYLIFRVLIGKIFPSKLLSE